jgi:hypothetical protein
MQPIKTCTERRLPADDVIFAAECAVAERPANHPLGVGPVEASQPERLRMAILTSKAWKTGRALHVRFLDGDPTVQSRVRDVSTQWMSYANIPLAFGDDPDAEIRISFLGEGSWSFVGMEALGVPRDAPTMNLGWLTPTDPDEEYARVTLHEFGHALGCVHEHQSPAAGVPWNTNAVYRFYARPPNGWSRAEVDTNVLQTYDHAATMSTEFDPKSIMIYPIPPELTIGGFGVEWNTALSEQDKDFIGTRYPFGDASIPELAVDADPVEGVLAAPLEEDTYQFTVTRPGEHILETFGTTDVLMALFGPDDDGRLVEEDNDSGLVDNAKIEAALLDGRYLVRVRRNDSPGPGKYTISIRRPWAALRRA